MWHKSKNCLLKIERMDHLIEWVSAKVTKMMVVYLQHLKWHGQIFIYKHRKDTKNRSSVCSRGDYMRERGRGLIVCGWNYECLVHSALGS